jgi:putative ABC transport system permease protein
MNESTRSTTSGRGTARWLGAMTVAEIALAITLVAGAGWLVRGFANLRSTPLGFATERRMIFDVTLLGAKYPNAQAVSAATQDLLTRIGSVPGITSAAATSAFPFRNSPESSLIAQFHGEPMDTAHPMGTRQRFVSDSYFNATGTPVLQGRAFGVDDRPTSTPVAVINRTFQTRYLKGRDPIGLRFAAGYPAPNPQNEVTVIGVVDDVRQKSVSEVPEPAYYSPMSQNPIRRFTVVAETSAGRETAAETAIRDEVRRFDPQVAVEFTRVGDLITAAMRRQQLGMTLMLIFGGVAILLAAVGIYGVVAYAVSQRRAEMATRLALGATPGSVFRLVMSQGAVLAGVGVAIGLGAAYLSGRLVDSKIYAIGASDHATLAEATAVVAVIAVLATMIPAWRASRLKPSSVLHGD